MIEGKTRFSELLAMGRFPEDAFFATKRLDGKKIITYGAGEGFHWVVEILMRHYGYRPWAVLDRRFKSGDVYEGIPAWSPFEYHPTEEEKRDAVVIVCVGKEEYHSEIIETLKELGFRDILLMMDVYEIHNPFRLPVALENRGFSYYLDHASEMIEALSLFADEASRELYVRCLENHLTRKPRRVPSRPPKEQYFPKDVPLSRGYSCFVNCGAYDGDTLRLLKEVHGKVDEIVCFETEPTLFARLGDYLRECEGDLANRVVAFPCAAYSREGLLRFKSGGGLGSRVTEDGDTWVQCVALDDVMFGFAPTFVCLDIEGAELDVLRGAERMLQRHRPDLGVCAYHSPNHLWEIPLYLHRLDLGYRLYLRNYTGFTAETVVYATT